MSYVWRGVNCNTLTMVSLNFQTLKNVVFKYKRFEMGKAKVMIAIGYVFEVLGFFTWLKVYDIPISLWMQAILILAGGVVLYLIGWGLERGFVLKAESEYGNDNNLLAHELREFMQVQHRFNNSVTDFIVSQELNTSMPKKKYAAKRRKSKHKL